MFRFLQHLNLKNAKNGDIDYQMASYRQFRVFQCFFVFFKYFLYKGGKSSFLFYKNIQGITVIYIIFLNVKIKMK